MDISCLCRILERCYHLAKVPIETVDDGDDGVKREHEIVGQTD